MTENISFENLLTEVWNFRDMMKNVPLLETELRKIYEILDWFSSVAKYKKIQKINQYLLSEDFKDFVKDLEDKKDDSKKSEGFNKIKEKIFQKIFCFL